MRVRTPREIGALVRDRRRDRDLSQDELARRARVSRRWLAAVEAGKPGAELGLVLRTLAVLELEHGEPARAAALLDEAIELARAVGLWRDLLSCLDRVGELCADSNFTLGAGCGNTSPATTSFKKSSGLWSRVAATSLPDCARYNVKNATSLADS